MGNKPDVRFQKLDELEDLIHKKMYRTASVFLNGVEDGIANKLITPILKAGMRSIHKGEDGILNAIGEARAILLDPPPEAPKVNPKVTQKISFSDRNGEGKFICDKDLQDKFRNISELIDKIRENFSQNRKDLAKANLEKLLELNGRNSRTEYILVALANVGGAYKYVQGPLGELWRDIETHFDLSFLAEEIIL